jgi:3-methyladenine DNA glycosylase Mpg
MRRGFAIAVLVVLCFPAMAVARRLVQGAEKTAIISAIRRAHAIGPTQTGSCMRVYVSTVNPNWATMQFIFVARCERQDANGVAVVHRTQGRWRFVTAGSAFTCPIPGHIPQRVQKDLKLGCIPR